MFSNNFLTQPNFTAPDTNENVRGHYLASNVLTLSQHLIPVRYQRLMNKNQQEKLKEN